MSPSQDRNNTYPPKTPRSRKPTAEEQLKRKRLHDRDAQRVLRQQTKEYIQQLEGQLEELRAKNQLRDTLIHENVSLEEEIRHLKSQYNAMVGSDGLEGIDAGGSSQFQPPHRPLWEQPHIATSPVGSPVEYGSSASFGPDSGFSSFDALYTHFNAALAPAIPAFQPLPQNFHLGGPSPPGWQLSPLQPGLNNPPAKQPSSSIAEAAK